MSTEGYYTGVVTHKTYERKDFPMKGAKYGKKLKKGKEVRISHAVKGQFHWGTDVWYVLDNERFASAGAIEASSRIDFFKKEILVTADDVGISKQIDAGAKLALRKGWINSIAVFVNRDAFEEDDSCKIDPELENFCQFLHTNSRDGEDQSLFETTHIGLHFTILSGKPVSAMGEVSPLLVGNRFKKFNGEIDGVDIDEAFVEAFKCEFEKQLKRFRLHFNKKPDHLTSHYDVHTFKPGLFEFFHKRSKDLGIPIRSHVFIPKHKRVLYDLFGVTDVDIMSIGRMSDWLDDHESKVFKGHNDSTHIGHYGPPTGIAVHFPNWLVKRKNNYIDKIVSDFLKSKETKTELMIHLVKPDEEDESLLDFRRREEAYIRDYRGVSIHYFAGRKAELESLERYGKWENKSFIKLLERS